jgi:hypothetical protein
MALVARASAPSPAKLRVGVFADSRLQPRWIVAALDRIARCGWAEIVAVVAPQGVFPDRPWWARLERWAFGSDLCEPVRLAAADSADRVALDLDVAFAIGDLDDSALDGIARLGVWRIRADGAREVANQEPVSGAAVTVRLAGGEAPRLACEHWGRTYPLSVARNRRALFERAIELPARALRDAQRYGSAWLGQRPVVREEAPARLPSLLDLSKRILERSVEKALHAEQWSLAFRFGALAPDLEGFTRLAPPPGRSWAHPFALARGGRYYVFFSDGGRIAMLQVDEAGAWSAPRVVLARDYPLSHPFLLEHEDALYMVPQSADGSTVELYRCVDFPFLWRLERVLIEGARLLDPTVHRGVDRWWIFAATGDDELRLFHAPHLAGGEWQPHARNPVKSDARSSRPAGALYWRNGALYRPAQICAPRHGAGVALNRVLRLGPGEYAERQVERILPAGDLLGLHTVNRAGALTVVDFLTRRRRV